MSVKIAITWTNDDVPELGGDRPLETCLSETREVSFAGSELGGKFPRDNRVLQPLLYSDLYSDALHSVSGWFDGRTLNKNIDDESKAISTRPVLAADEMRTYGAKIMSFIDEVMERVSTIARKGSVDSRVPRGIFVENSCAGRLGVEAEQGPQKANPLAYAAVGYRCLKLLAKSAGMAVEVRR
ncbi:hypothetical protein HJB77_27715 [Rhizobium lentis]|uniref:hypothetical protein n=1 Tax=Rhizobium lentis TaxID=1138194 RepID=UPI001C82FAE0|nr:hypothetical protein [Rhizobium lentis]MBX5180006.1 hypothetical protein [Rhizobium lentis]